MQTFDKGPDWATFLLLLTLTSIGCFPGSCVLCGAVIWVTSRWPLLSHAQTPVSRAGVLRKWGRDPPYHLEKELCTVDSVRSVIRAHTAQGALQTRNTVQPILETTVCSVGTRGISTCSSPRVPFHPGEQTPPGGFVVGKRRLTCW